MDYSVKLSDAVKSLRRGLRKSYLFIDVGLVGTSYVLIHENWPAKRSVVHPKPNQIVNGNVQEFLVDINAEALEVYVGIEDELVDLQKISLPSYLREDMVESELSRATIGFSPDDSEIEIQDLAYMPIRQSATETDYLTSLIPSKKIEQIKGELGRFAGRIISIQPVSCNYLYLARERLTDDQYLDPFILEITGPTPKMAGVESGIVIEFQHLRLDNAIDDGEISTEKWKDNIPDSFERGDSEMLTISEGLLKERAEELGLESNDPIGQSDTSLGMISLIMGHAAKNSGALNHQHAANPFNIDLDLKRAAAWICSISLMLVSMLVLVIMVLSGLSRGIIEDLNVSQSDLNVQKVQSARVDNIVSEIESLQKIDRYRSGHAEVIAKIEQDIPRSVRLESLAISSKRGGGSQLLITATSNQKNGLQSFLENLHSSAYLVQIDLVRAEKNRDGTTEFSLRSEF